MPTEVVCPHCGTTRPIVPKYGTNKKMIDRKVRCPKSLGGCGKNYWYKNAIVIKVPQYGTKKIYQDKISNKDEIIEDIHDIMKKYKKSLPLDVLRSKKLELETIGEMRKK